MQHATQLALVGTSLGCSAPCTHNSSIKPNGVSRYTPSNIFFPHFAHSVPPLSLHIFRLSLGRLCKDTRGLHAPNSLVLKSPAAQRSRFKIIFRNQFSGLCFAVNLMEVSSVAPLKKQRINIKLRSLAKVHCIIAAHLSSLLVEIRDQQLRCLPNIVPWNFLRSGPFGHTQVSCSWENPFSSCIPFALSGNTRTQSLIFGGPD